MVYNDPEALPERFSNSQDHFGYFNNASNVTLIPKTESYYFEDFNPYLADREPDFDYAVKGSLDTLYYPTGGFSNFEYEAPQRQDYAVEKITLETYCSYDYYTPDTRLMHTHSITEPMKSGSNGSFINQYIDITLDIYADKLVNHQYKVYLRVIDLTNNKTEEEMITMSDGNIVPVEYHEEYTFHLDQGVEYHIQLEIEPDDEDVPPHQVHATANFKYVIGNKNVDGLGFRIKRIYDCASEDSDPVIKRYYYSPPEKINDGIDYGIYSAHWGNYMSYFYMEKCCGDVFRNRDILLMQSLNANSIRSTFPTNDNDALYPDVTISYGGDNFENGGVHKHFQIIPSQYPLEVLNTSTSPYSGYNAVIKENNDMYNDLLRHETIIKKGDDGSLYKSKTVDYEYYGPSWTYITNMLISREERCLAESYTVDGLSISTYNTYSKINNPISVITKEFLDLVPIDEDDTEQYKQIVTREDYIYGNRETEPYIKAGIPLAVFHSTENDEKVNITKFNYPFNPPEGVDPHAANYDDLKDAHVWTEPIQIENYYGELVEYPNPVEYDPSNLADLMIDNPDLNRVSTKRTLYNFYYTPCLIQTSAGDNPLEDKITLFGINGRIYEYRLDNDIPVAFIWGYNYTLPVAKIVGEEQSSFMIAITDDIQDVRDDQTLRDMLAPLRAQYPDALITIYTYDTMTGMTSETDPNGKTTYYEYDDMGRLKLIRDNENNIIKSYEYNLIFSSPNSLDNFFKITNCFFLLNCPHKIRG
jgi:YD repeat-containing protein